MGNVVLCSKKTLCSKKHFGIVKLVLVTPNGEKVLFYRSRSSQAGKRWFSEIQRTTAGGLPIKDPWRVYNAPGGTSTVKLIADFENCINIINSYIPGTIPKDVVLDAAMPVEKLQESLNYAHTFFEIMMHSADKPADFFLGAPEAVQQAIEHYNLLIHALEDDSRAKQKRKLGEQADVRAVVTFAGRRRVPLRKAELQDFGLARNFGVAYLNYCMVGKHLWEACRDQDQVTGVLRPQTHLSADTLLWFGPSPSTEKIAEMERNIDEWWDREGIETKFGRHDPASAVGYLPVGDLCRNDGDVKGFDEESITHLLSNASILSFTAV